MLKATRLVCKLRSDILVSEPPTSFEDEKISEIHDSFNSSKVLRIPQQFDNPHSFHLTQSDNLLLKHGLASSISACKSISFIRCGKEFELTHDSLNNLIKMLRFNNEICYHRPYRLIADSKLCLKGKCDNLSDVLRTGY